jgi:hypothetical protein
MSHPMSQRRLVALAGAALAAGTSLVALAPPAGAATSPWCGNADLHAAYHATDSGAGHRFGQIVLTNTSHHTCRTGGFGGLSYVGFGNGTRIGAPADRVASPHPVVALRPGQRVVSAVSETVASNVDPDTCKGARVDGFRVYVPDARKSQFVAHRTFGCQNGAVHLLSHHAFVRP